MRKAHIQNKPFKRISVVCASHTHPTHTWMYVVVLKCWVSDRNKHVTESHTHAACWTGIRMFVSVSISHSLVRSFAIWCHVYISNERTRLVSRCRIFNSCLQVEIYRLASNTCSSFQQHLLTDFIRTALNFPSHIHTILFIRLHTIPSISCADWGSINRLNRGFFFIHEIY